MKIFYKPSRPQNAKIDTGKGGKSMKNEIRTAAYDEELRIEAYRFEGIIQPFPNHFHEYYVLGAVESGERCLSCRGRRYSIAPGNVRCSIPATITPAYNQTAMLLITAASTSPRKSCLISQRK